MRRKARPAALSEFHRLGSIPPRQINDPDIVTISGDTDELALARDIVEVHGTRAAGVARENARVAALAGQAMLAKSWIRVLGAIQRHQANPPKAPLPIES